MNVHPTSPIAKRQKHLIKLSEKSDSGGAIISHAMLTPNLPATIIKEPPAAMISHDPLLFPSTVSVSPTILSTTRAIPLTFDQMMDQRLDQVARDKIFVFVMISSVISTIPPFPLLDLAASSQFEVTHDDNLPSTNHADVC